MKPSGSREAGALRILRAIPGLTVTAEVARTDDGADAVLEFGGSETPVAVQVKNRASAATAWQIVHQAAARPGAPVLLIAEETTADARQILTDHGIAVVDNLGNTHIELPGLLIHLEGRASRPRARPARLSGKAGVVAQALLAHPRRGWQVQELADEAGVSIGLAHRVLARLVAEGIVAVEGAGRDRVRRVTNPTVLLDLWAEEDMPRTTRIPAYLLAQSPRQLIENLGRDLERNAITYALTGAAGASLVAPFLTAIPIAEVWVSAVDDPAQLAELAGAELVADGYNVVFLQGADDTPLAFREQAGDLWIASRFRLYADLRRDPRRGREQADHLRQEMIGF